MANYQEWINCTIAAINLAVAIANGISHRRYCRWSASLDARESALSSATTASKRSTCLRANSGTGDVRTADESFSISSPLNELEITAEAKVAPTNPAEQGVANA